MDEISSLDSYHTEPEASVVEEDEVPKTTDLEGDSINADRDVESAHTDELQNEQTDATTAAAAGLEDDDGEREISGEEAAVTQTAPDGGSMKSTDEAVNNEDDEFDQISEGTFEVDDNSLPVSAGVVAIEEDNDGQSQGEPNDEDNAEEQKTEASLEEESLLADVECRSQEKEELSEQSKAVTAEEAEDGGAETSDTQKSTDFEEVDANVSTSVTAVEEADMLGESDMTLPDDNNDETEEREERSSSNVLEVEKDDTEFGSEMDGGETEKVAILLAPEVDMESPSDSPSLDKMVEGKSTKEFDIDMKDDSVEMADEGGESVITVQKDTSVDTAVDKDNSNVVLDDNENSLEDKQTQEMEKDDGENSKEEHQMDDMDAEVIEEAETAQRNVEAMDEDDPEQDDEPVENVQEPEESDVCLIPDDTETQMTEAEKEQAILARENAEKEELKDDVDVKEQANELNAEDANEIGIREDEMDEGITAADGNEDGVENAEAADGGDEPLLEEVQSGAMGESASAAKIIIAWIVARTQACVQCEETKMCGFRYKNAETNEAEFLCGQACCDALLAANEGKYFIRRKKFLVEELNADATLSATDDTTDKETTDDGAAAATDEEETTPTTSESNVHSCLQCKQCKSCKYFFKQDDESFYICNDDCFNLLSTEEPDKFKLKRHSIRVRNIGATTLVSADSLPASKKSQADSRVVARTAAEAEAARLERVLSFTRRCVECLGEVNVGDKSLLWETMDFCNEICLGKYQRTIGSNCQTCHGEVPHQALGKYCVRFGFEIRQFCCATCLNEFKKGLKTCSCCQKDISSGNEGFLAPVGDKEQFKDFCSQTCMRRYDAMCNPKKKIRNDICSVCSNDKPVRVEILLDDKEHNFCSNPCFSAFKFVSNIVADQCGMCSKYFERKGTESFTIYSDRRAKVFCSRICLNVYIIVNRKIVSCQWCKVKKYNFDMIYKQHNGQDILMCSLNCLTLYGVSVHAFSRTVANCDNCNNSATPQYHLTMSDASMRNFCTYQCVMQFQNQFARAPLTLDSSDPQGQQQANAGANKSLTPFPTGLPKRVKLKNTQQPQSSSSSLQVKISAKNNTGPKKGPSGPVISAVSSLASGETETMIGNVTVRRSRGRGRKVDSPPPSLSSVATIGRGRPRRNVDYARSPSPGSVSPSHSASKRNISILPSPQPQSGGGGSVGGSVGSGGGQSQEKVPSMTETKIIVVPPYPAAVRNVQTSCKPQTVTVGFQCEPTMKSIATQTNKDYSNKVLIPVPVPLYIPQPMYMYSLPFPVPVPIPLPIPVPIFIPTTRNSAQGILKEIKKIQDKMPSDPFEAELLMMAEMVAEEKRESDSDSDDEIKPDPGAAAAIQYDNNVSQVEVSNNSYGEDVLQMALKMATGEYDQPTVDLESAMTANTITHPPPGMVGHDDSLTHMSATHHLQQEHLIDEQRGSRVRKRVALGSPGTPRNNRSPVKRQRLQELESPSPVHNMPPAEKPDANMCLKYTFGVNAWKQWVMTKNSDIEKSSIRRRPFKTELLQMTADELNYSLCLFVKEVRKPNGTEYAPDTIYYLVLGIQQYLYENGRIDNIFTDPYYERFTDCLDDVARKFSVLYNDSQYIVTRVEEEHLWECKQLGAHSPHVLLSTLMFFNTKHFNLTTVEEHMQLSFSHIMKHWKRSAQNAKSPGTRNVLLRFYPPQAGLDANPRKKKVYEQQENEENPLRCPVRLYEFYLSKCPESVKTRNDVFYLQPERSCVPDSPVWYSTQALSQESLQKMLHRVKMVKEINIALLTS